MIKWSRTLIAGGTLILLTNAVVLLGAAYNRGEEPESQLRLSQRELQHYRPGFIQGNSGIALALNWRVVRKVSTQELDYGLGYSAGKWGMPVWLNKAKLAELGFDADKLTSTSGDRKKYKEPQSKDVLLVLELNGLAYQQELQRARDHAGQAQALQAGNPGNEELKRRAKSAGEIYQHEQRDNSRLFAIDAGVDLQKLRTTYPDRTRYAIVHGVIHPSMMQEKDATQVVGYIRELHAERINVPLNYRPVFDTTAPYEVTVAFGKRLEPWINSASKGVVIK
jgi:Domain of unknown function (DUF4824)